jgi:hypothetical protein
MSAIALYRTATEGIRAHILFGADPNSRVVSVLSRGD